MEWTNVKNSLPENYSYVLVSNDTKTSEPRSISIARYEIDEWNFLFGNDNEGTSVACSDLTWSMRKDEITHWMPLPEPPKE